MATCRFTVDGLDCPTEAGPLRNALEPIDGVLNVGVDAPAGLLIIDYDPAKLSPDKLLALIPRVSGMTAHILKPPSLAVFNPPAPVVPQSRLWLLLPILISGLGALLGTVAQQLSWPTTARVLFLITIAVAFREVTPKMALSLVRFRLNIHVLIGMAMLGAMALDQWDETAALGFLFLLAEALESRSVQRAQNAVRGLWEETPRFANVVHVDDREHENGSEHVHKVRCERVRVGQQVRVRAGETVPLDGVIIAGESHVDQKSLTGEPMPLRKIPGDTVFAGSVNGEGALTIRTQKPFDQSLLARVLDQVRTTRGKRAEVEQLVEKFAGWYTPCVFALAIGIMLIPPFLLGGLGATPRDWFYRGLVVLVIACPCALVIATPVAIVCGITTAARRGVLIKSGRVLEAAGRLKRIAFDKTGTLTTGRPEVVDVISVTAHRNPPDNDSAHQSMVTIAAAVSALGTHVVGQAFARHARDRQWPVPHAEGYLAAPGLGASALVNSVRYHMGSHRYLHHAGLCDPSIHDRLETAESEVGTSVALSNPDGPLGWFQLSDTPRPEAAATVEQLSRLGVTPIMITGDAPAAAAALAKSLGVAEFFAGMLPEDKVRIIQSQQTEHGPIGMVGDGVNDALALAAAAVSITPHGTISGSALDTADILLLADDLQRIPWLIHYSRRIVDRIRTNILLALLTKLIVFILALQGHANLWMAIAADLGATLVVVANAAQLIREPAWPPPPTPTKTPG